MGIFSTELVLRLLLSNGLFESHLPSLGSVSARGCQLPHAVLRWKKARLPPSPQIKEANVENLSCFTFSPFRWQWQSFLSQNSFYRHCDKGQREWKSTVPRCQDSGSSLKTEPWRLGSVSWGIALLGVAWSPEQQWERQTDREGQTEGEGQATPL